jgi:phosphate transport system substrate-binding protein
MAPDFTGAFGERGMDEFVDRVSRSSRPWTINRERIVFHAYSVKTACSAVQWFVAAALFVAAGCAPTVSAQPTPDSASGQLTGTLNVGGSTALQPLVEQAARSFQAANPGVQIVVSGGGSGAGRSGVCQGSLDIGMSDVTLLGSEISSLNCGDAIQTAVAMDVFVVAANPTGPGKLSALDREQMEAIFTGAVNNWSELGGANQPLTVINRIKGSGTRQSMANYLFSGDDSLFQGNLAEQESNDDVASSLNKTPGAISYLGAAYLGDPGLVTFGIRRPEGLVLPTKDVIAGLQWPIGGPGVAITRGQPNGLAAAFINFLISPQFQSDPVWSMLGYVPPARPAIGNPIGQ